MSVFLGIDTSNYTTSAAIISDGEVTSRRRVLTLSDGKKGLRQSDALFEHVKHLPEIISSLDFSVSPLAIGYSERPRDIQGSYMPCFLAGKAVALSLASALSVPAFSFSHQAGHVMAAVFKCGADLLKGEFLAFHVSGGTTELLRVTPKRTGSFDIDLLGGTKDLNAGQLIDRVGVLYGLDFPCGMELERLSAECGAEKPRRFGICVDGLECNLSGAENKLNELYSGGVPAGVAALSVFDFTARTLCKMKENARKLYPSLPVLFAGGVMNNKYIRNYVADENVFFAGEGLSSDNAVGTALLAKQSFELGGRNE